MNLTILIESAERRFRQILEDFFVSVYDERKLCSHGINHHRRVWGFAREILSLHPITDSLSPACDPEKLIIACYLHDIGMSADPGPRHGKKSRELCQNFLEKCNLDPDNFTDLLETIENHDYKDYVSDISESSLLRVLSLADDLDAFGYTGIYRYSEIYLKRGISPSELGYRILDNAQSRFDNFKRALSADYEYVSRHRVRYEILDDFFLNYNKQAKAYNFETDYPSGYCGVVQLFMLMIRMNLSVSGFFDEAGRHSQDSIIAAYLKGLQTEFSAFNKDE
jgi:HD superfamily phosphodiesterase